MEKTKVYTDGCCLKNPAGPGGYGMVIIRNGCAEEYSCGFRKTTNNRMELMAFLDALMETPEEEEIEFISDSKYAIGVLGGTMVAQKNRDLVSRIKELLRNRKCSFTWVKGHSGNRYNELCDAMAFSAANGNRLFKDSGYEDEDEAEEEYENYLERMYAPL